MIFCPQRPPDLLEVQVFLRFLRSSQMDEQFEHRRLPLARAASRAAKL